MRERQENVTNNSRLVIIVGESGVGKSTFCKAMDVDGKWFGSSKVIADELKKTGQPVNHDRKHRDCAALRGAEKKLRKN